MDYFKEWADATETENSIKMGIIAMCLMVEIKNVREWDM